MRNNFKIEILSQDIWGGNTWEHPKCWSHSKLISCMECKQRITGTERNAEIMCFKSKLKISGESLVLCIILLVEMCHGIFPEWNWILESHVCVLCEHEKVRESHFLHSITVFQFYGRHLNHFEPKMGVLVLKFWPSHTPLPPLR